VPAGTGVTSPRPAPPDGCAAVRDRAWKRILAAAKRYDVDVSESSWRDLSKGGKDRKR
jgi:hypothetical protein